MLTVQLLLCWLKQPGYFLLDRSKCHIRFWPHKIKTVSLSIVWNNHSSTHRHKQPTFRRIMWTSTLNFNIFNFNGCFSPFKQIILNNKLTFLTVFQRGEKKNCASLLIKGMQQYFVECEWTVLIEPLHGAIMHKLTHQWVAAVVAGASGPSGSNLELTVLLKVTWQHSTVDPSITGNLFTSKATAAHVWICYLGFNLL